jgi:type VI secretion system secreted protein Hcp
MQEIKMAGDIFLKLDGVQGESEKADHKNEIEIETVSWGASNPTSFAHGGGGGVGKVHIQDIHFTKAVDKSSPTIYNFCCNGKHIKEAVFTFRKAGEEARDYLKITLTDVMIASFSLQDHSGGGSLAHESISLSFSKITGKYAPQDAKGGLAAGLPFGWNVKEHKPEQ